MTGIEQACNIMSQLRIAGALNVSQQRVQQWHKRGWVTPEVAAYLRAATGVPMHRLVREEHYRSALANDRRWLRTGGDVELPRKYWR